MMLKSLFAGAAFAVLASASAQAAVVYAGPSPEMATDQSFSLDVNGTGASTPVSFIIDGYLSLDGQNFYEDDFSLALNGATVFTGTFNLGGGGSDVVYSNPDGATATNLGNLFFLGGKEQVSFAGLNLNPGVNTLTFSYTSLEDGHAGFQGLGDERWGVENVNVGGVPEPATWAMMLMGFGGLGAAMRSHRKTAAIAA